MFALYVEVEVQIYEVVQVGTAYKKFGIFALGHVYLAAPV
jgi:hypothetical protein